MKLIQKFTVYLTIAANGCFIPVSRYTHKYLDFLVDSSLKWQYLDNSSLSHCLGLNLDFDKRVFFNLKNVIMCALKYKMGIMALDIQLNIFINYYLPYKNLLGISLDGRRKKSFYFIKE